MAIKGNLVVGQSGGPTVVINQALVGVVEEALKHADDSRESYGARNGLEGTIREDFHRPAQAVARRRLRTWPETAVRVDSGRAVSSRRRRTASKIFEIFTKHNVRYFFYIGGNDSALSPASSTRSRKEQKYDL
jgi:6-phosphofructokinase